MYLANYAAQAKSPENAAQVCRLFRHTLQLLQEPGYTQGFCTINVDDPRSVFMVELWGNMPALRAWLDSKPRQQLLRQIEPLIEGPVQTTVYEEAM